MLVSRRGRRPQVIIEGLERMTAVKARPVPLPEGGPVVASSGLGLIPKGLLVLLVLATLVSDTILTHYDILMSVGPGAVLVAVLAETVGRASPVTEHALTSPPSLQFKRFSFELLNFLSHRRKSRSRKWPHCEKGYRLVAAPSHSSCPACFLSILSLPPQRLSNLCAVWKTSVCRRGATTAWPCGCTRRPTTVCGGRTGPCPSSCGCMEGGGHSEV